MLRTILISAVALAATTGFASAQPRQHTQLDTPLGSDVVSDDGTTVLGRVTQVERNSRGRIVAAQVSGMEPADAPRAPTDAIAQNDDRRLVSYRRNRDGGGIFTGPESATR